MITYIKRNESVDITTNITKETSTVVLYYTETPHYIGAVHTHTQIYVCIHA